MGGVPSVPTDPNRSLQVIGAGFARTGTVSMALALEKILDGPVCHGGTQLLGREDAYVQKWLAVYAAKDNKPKRLAALREVTRGFVAITDTPGTHFIEDLCEIYPDAQVIGWRRDPEKWWKSMEQMIKHAMPGWLRWYLIIMPGWRWFPVIMGEMSKRERDLSGSGILEHYYSKIERIVPENRMYWVELSDGWAPLCKILDKPIPDCPFPRANDSKAVEETARYVFKRTALAWMGLMGVLLAVSMFLWYMY
ncbi:hypothetical protein BBK36DRAFT_1129459 [Trichoderma citrinoviride]|uniref:NAD dependent epimerase/dehydratase n=1 Tax=Trichoderma citrinoviride TaxID=58853 RepID=A0A2T4AZD8_9HYPO|nr:hypothetical protein BBK36DRAFT_1129459 [Trichoderma citrinoviride]PTB62341.1 hypothetical protein BBK36DRAFT_1129459 [Trichoderma citrinoviride]